MKDISLGAVFAFAMLHSQTLAAQSAPTNALPPVATPPVNVLLPNYNVVPIGESGALEGGAFVARANDSSAAFYNPAGLSRAERSSVSGTAGLFQLGAVSAEGLGASGRTFQQVPAMFAFLLKDVLGHDRLGAGFSIARSSAWRQNVDFERTTTGAGIDRLSYTSAAVFDTWLTSLAVGYAGTGKWRGGGSLDIQYTSTDNRQTVADQFRTSTGLTALTTTSRADGSAAHLRLTAGTQYEITRALIVGAVVRTRGWGIWSSGASILEGVSSNDITTTASFFDDDVNANLKVPFEFTTGVAFIGSRAQLEVDLLSYAGAGEYRAFTTGRPVTIVVDSGGGTAPVVTDHPASPPAIDSRAVANLALGGQFKLTSTGSWVVHGGYGTSRSPVGPHDTVFTKVHLQTLTAGVSGRTKYFLGSFGLQYVGGDSDPIPLRETPSGQVTTSFTVRNVSFVYSLSVLF